MLDTIIIICALTGVCVWVVAGLFIAGLAWHMAKQWWTEAIGGRR